MKWMECKIQLLKLFILPEKYLKVKFMVPDLDRGLANLVLVNKTV